MSDFIEHFVREPDGAWRCVSDVEIAHARGRIQVAKGALFPPGTIFMGVDIAQLPEDEARR